MSDITTSLADKVQDKVEDAKDTGALYKSEVVGDVIFPEYEMSMARWWTS